MLYDVSIEIIQRCLNNCIHCSSNSCKESQEMLSLPLVREILDDISELGAQRVCLSGGEPFLHGDLVDIVGYAASKGLRVGIYSSGIIGSAGEESPLDSDILDRCRAAGLSRVMFNLQAARSDIYDLITGTTGNFGRARESIRRCKESGIDTEIHFVPMRQNLGEIEAVIELAESAGICQVSFLRMVPHGRAKQNEGKIALSEEEVARLQERLYALSDSGKRIRIGIPLSRPGEAGGCHAVKEKLYVKFDGCVFGCEAFKYIRFHDEQGREIKPDNVKNKRLKEILHTSEYLRLSSELVNRFACEESGCESCPVQKYLKCKKDGNGNVQNQ